MSTKFWFDPPSGWMYGFPKLWDFDKSPDLRQWFLDNGYPEKDVDFAMNYLRHWKEED